MPYLDRLPESTFGGAYAAFMRNHTFHPDDRDEVRFIEEEDLAYVMLRHRQIHDFAHVLWYPVACDSNWRGARSTYARVASRFPL